MICSLIQNYIVDNKSNVTYKSLLCIYIIRILLVASLQLQEEELKHCIHAIGYIYSECLKNNVNPFDFADVIGDVHLDEKTIAILLQTYDEIVIMSLWK